MCEELTNKWWPPTNRLVLDKEGEPIGRLTGVAEICGMDGCTGVRWYVKKLEGGTIRPCCKSLLDVEHEGLPALKLAWR